MRRASLLACWNVYDGRAARPAGRRVKFARVIGTVVATQKYQGLKGIKFLGVQPLDREQRPACNRVIGA